jgi:hypothetical protein
MGRLLAADNDATVTPVAPVKTACIGASAGDLGKVICGISRSRTLRRFRTPALRR